MATTQTVTKELSLKVDTNMVERRLTIHVSWTEEKDEGSTTFSDLQVRLIDENKMDVTLEIQKTDRDSYEFANYVSYRTMLGLR